MAEGAPYFAAAYLHEVFCLCIDGLDLSVCGKSTIGTLVFTLTSFWLIDGIDLLVCGKSSIGTLVYFLFFSGL